MEEYAREPCPWRIVDDCGGAFAMGLAGGSIFHAFKGFRGATPGTSKLREMVKTVKLRAPITGGQFAMWGFTFSSVDCMLVKLRKKEDAMNSILAGGATGALLAVRAGVPTMIGSAVVGAVLLGLIEGVGIFITRLSADQYRQQNPSFEDPASLPPKPPSGPGGDAGSATPSSRPFGGPQLNMSYGPS